jgi:hypothetical protein
MWLFNTHNTFCCSGVTFWLETHFMRPGSCLCNELHKTMTITPHVHLPYFELFPACAFGNFLFFFYLPHLSNNIILYFIAPEHTCPESGQFAAILEGFQNLSCFSLSGLTDFTQNGLRNFSKFDGKYCLVTR